MANVCAQGSPRSKQDGQRSSNSSREHKSYDLWWRLGIAAEDVVNLGLGGVAYWRVGDA